MPFDTTHNRVCAIFALFFTLGFPPTIAAAQPVPSPTIAGPGFGIDTAEFEIAAPPTDAGDLDALADALRKLVVRIGAVARPTLGQWQRAASEIGVRVIYLGHRDAKEIVLPALAEFASHSADATQRRDAAKQAQAAARRRGFDLRAFGNTIVFADANLAYTVAPDADWPVVSALANGSMEALERALLDAPAHPLRAGIEARLRAAVMRRLRAATDADSFVKLHDLWGAYADVGIIDQLRWLEVRDNFAIGDFAAMGEFAAGGSTDSPAIAFAARIAARHAAITNPDSVPLPTADADLAADLAWWRQHAPQADRIANREPLPAAYWRLAPYADAATAARLAQQVRAFGNDSAMRAIFDGIGIEHLAVLLATAKWQSTHADALAWLADRICTRAATAVLSQIERDALAAAVAPLVAGETELRDVIIDRLIRPLGLVEAMPELLAVSKAGDVSAMRAATDLAADVAAENGVAGRALKELRGGSASAEQIAALCRLAMAGLDESATAPLMAIIRDAQHSPQIRIAAIDAVFVIAPADAIAIADEWAAKPPGTWAQPIIARLRIAAPIAPSPFKAPATNAIAAAANVAELLGILAADGSPANLAAAKARLHTDWPSAVAIIGAVNLPTPALAALESALQTAGLAPFRLPDSASAIANCFARRIEIAPPPSAGQGGLTSLAISNLPMAWRSPIRLTGRTERETCSSKMSPAAFVLVRAVDPWPVAFPNAPDEIARFATRLAGLPVESMPAPSPTEPSPPPSMPLSAPNGTENQTEPPILPAPLPSPTPPTRTNHAAVLRLHVAFDAVRFTEFAPSAALQDSFATGSLLAFNLEFDWRDALPAPFGLQATADFGVLLLGEEIWRDQTNDLSILAIAVHFGAFVEPIAAREPADWGLRIGLSPGLKLFSIARTNVVTNGSPQADESITRTYFAGRIDAQIWNERAFDASVPIGLIAAGEFRLTIGPGSGFGVEWFAGLTWAPEPAFVLVLAITNRYEELFAEADRKFASNGFGARLAFALRF